MTNELKRCEALIGKYADLWKSIEIRGVAVRLQNKWVALEIAVGLSEKSLEEHVLEQNDLGIPWLKIIHHRVDIAALPNILRGFEKRVVDVGEIIYITTTMEPEKEHALSFWFRKFEKQHYQFRSFSPAIILQSTFAVAEILSKLPEYSSDNGRFFDDQFKMSKVPYNGRGDFLGAFLGEKQAQTGPSEMGRITLFGDLALKFTRECCLSQNSVVLGLAHHKGLNVSEINIGVIGYADEVPVIRNNYPMTEFQTTTINKNISIKIPLTYHSQITAADIFLIFRDEVVSSIKLNDAVTVVTNKKMSLYEKFDKDLRALKDQLLSDDASRFEAGIALVMHFGGFDTAGYGLIKGKKGITGIQEEIDIVAFANLKHIIAIECTTKDINSSDKISKFSRKIKEVNELLPEYSIMPFIFTGLELQKISATDLDKAKKERIGILAIEDIQGLLSLVSKNKPMPDVLAYFKKYTPPSEGFQWDAYSG